MATANQNFAADATLPLASSNEKVRTFLRFTTAGSVDDGKSTLIGRLLYDSQSVYEDQLASVRNSRINRASGPIDFSLLTDGLRAEREQGITIDVAYRYFSTPRRKFIIADTPGHEQYTRNMATGASTADAAVVLIDATKGVLPQSRRHAYISTLLGIRAVVAAVNKMDLVDYSEDVFRRISSDLVKLGDRLGIESLYVIPISALEGDNIVHRSTRMPWFSGPTLLRYLEELDVAVRDSSALRLPVQYVIRPDAQFRGFAGQVESGTIGVGDPITVLPSGVRATVRSIESFDGPRESASAGDPVTVTLNEEVDISRGDLLSSSNDQPTVSQKFEADVVWMNQESLDRTKLYALKHTTRNVRARVNDIRHLVDVNNLKSVKSSTLQLNDIAHVEVSTTAPIFFDPYARNRTMGSFILIDPITNATVAAGTITAAVKDVPTRHERVTVAERAERHGHPPALAHIQGTSKVADAMERALFEDGWHVYLMNADDYNQGQLETLLPLLHSTGAIVILFGAADISDKIRTLFNNAVFNFEASHERERDFAGAALERLRRWREELQAERIDADD